MCYCHQYKHAAPLRGGALEELHSTRHVSLVSRPAGKRAGKNRRPTAPELPASACRKAVEACGKKEHAQAVLSCRAHRIRGLLQCGRRVRQCSEVALAAAAGDGRGAPVRGRGCMAGGASLHLQKGLVNIPVNVPEA